VQFGESANLDWKDVGTCRVSVAGAETKNLQKTETKSRKLQKKKKKNKTLSLYLLSTTVPVERGSLVEWQRNR
jgi:hypothetical protein